jgi:hypothetical protein
MTMTRCLLLAAAASLSAAVARAEDGHSYEANSPVTQDYSVSAPGQMSMPEQSAWHAGYYHTMWGRPVALVVPLTATHQTNWGWGIGNTRVTPIHPQFQGPMSSGVAAMPYGPYRPTPYYVSDTLQFGVYYIRGPW